MCAFQLKIDGIIKKEWCAGKGLKCNKLRGVVKVKGVDSVMAKSVSQYKFQQHMSPFLCEFFVLLNLFLELINCALK